MIRSTLSSSLSRFRFASSNIRFCSFKTQQQNDQQISLTIDQSWNYTDYKYNELYYAAHSYLPTRVMETYKALKVGKLWESKNLQFAVDGSEEVVDEFEGTKFTWVLDVEKIDKKNVGSFNLSFDKKYREKAIQSYIPHVLKSYEDMKAEERPIQIHSWNGGWDGTELSHPATFDTLALDPEIKKTIIADLERFLKRKEFYKKVGKPWKRGYLLDGPPGTGKSSLIAAIANYLKFDVYDFQLSSISSDSTLRRMVSSTPSRSIIVIEDIDCNKIACGRTSDSDSDDSDSDDEEDITFTLSGLLNYMDGLWSRSGEEKIVIFTTNHKDKIDPALLRSGRMDMHINFPFLNAKAFRILASNYLDIQDHPLFEQIEEQLGKIEVSPAVVAEQIIRNENHDLALDELLKFLKEMELQKEAEKPEDN